MSITARKAALLRERSMGYCEVGGEVLRDSDRAIHHRRLRSHGGSDRLSNLMVVCHGHHNLSTRSIHLQVATAHTNGWIVTEEDPAQVLVRLHGKWWAYLGDDGQYLQASPGLAELVEVRREMGGVS